jgi:predicted GNAT family acetyltransferase
MEIKRKDNGREGVFKAMEGHTEMGEMTYIWRGSDEIVITHTGVEPEYEGQGVGKQMVLEAIEFARENKIKIVPLCPFVQALFNRLPGVGDVWAE